MVKVAHWVKEVKTPVPSRHIVTELVKEGIAEPTVLVAIRELCKKGYIRKTVLSSQRSCFYVQLRSLNTTSVESLNADFPQSPIVKTTVGEW